MANRRIYTLPQEKKENFDFVYVEAKDTRKELICRLDEHRDHLWKIITFTLVVMGAYITITSNLIDKNYNISWYPFAISISLIMIALLISFHNVAPRKHIFIINQNLLPGLIDLEYDSKMRKVINTYVNLNKIDQYNIEKNAYIRKIIHILLIVSISEYILFFISTIAKSYQYPIISASISILIAFVFFIIIYIHIQIGELERLKKDLKIVNKPEQKEK